MGLFDGIKKSTQNEKCVYFVEHSHYEVILSAQAFFDFKKAEKYFNQKALGFTHSASNKEESIGDGIVELRSRNKSDGEVVTFRKVSSQ